MIRYPIKFLIGFIVFAFLLFLGGFYFWGDKIDDFLSGIHEQSGLAFIGWLASTAEITHNLGLLSDTSDKVNSILDEKAKLESQLTFLKSVEDENVFLREALGLPEKSRPNPILGGVFASISGPQGHYYLINKGSHQGIKLDQGVISEKGVLIGRIDEVSEDHSRAVSLTDATFKVTVKTFESNISGIAQGALNLGMTMDFVAENENIKEGEMIITSGNDFLPAGLIIGKIRSIEHEAGNLFKKVAVSPSVWDFAPTMVLIISE